MKNAEDKIIIHNTCGLPVELCDCPDAPVKYDFESDIFKDISQCIGGDE